MKIIRHPPRVLFIITHYPQKLGVYNIYKYNNIYSIINIYNIIYIPPKIGCSETENIVLKMSTKSLFLKENNNGN